MQRKDIPDGVTNAQDTIDPTNWGTPSAAWPASDCDVNKFFTPQQLVLDITLCGDWCARFQLTFLRRTHDAHTSRAGQPNLYQSTCGGTLGNSTVDVCVRPHAPHLSLTAADADTSTVHR